jgi:hypothetical protein
MQYKIALTIDAKHVLRMPLVFASPAFIGNRIYNSCAMISLIKRHGNEALASLALFTFAMPFCERLVCQRCHSLLIG